MPRTIVVVEHDPKWAQEYAAEGKRIRVALGDLVVAMHHVGSTAIPGILAKPIIDLLLEVSNIKELDQSRSQMEALGYQAKGEYGIPGRRYYRKGDSSGNRTHQVHAFEAGSQEVVRHLAFRDYMIAHPVQAQLYSELKRKLATENVHDIQAYMEGKDPFIKEHEEKATAWWSSRMQS